MRERRNQVAEAFALNQNVRSQRGGLRKRAPVRIEFRGVLRLVVAIVSTAFARHA